MRRRCILYVSEWVKRFFKVCACVSSFGVFQRELWGEVFLNVEKTPEEEKKIRRRKRRGGIPWSSFVRV